MNILSVSIDDITYFGMILDELVETVNKYNCRYTSLVNLASQHQCCNWLCEPKITYINNHIVIESKAYDFEIRPTTRNNWQSFALKASFRDAKAQERSIDYAQISSLTNIQVQPA